jgi:Pentapeptide repeats (8 copies)
MKNRVAWGLAVVLAAMTLGGIGWVAMSWAKAYRIARHQGKQADLHGAFLMYAPLASADLEYAHLQQANLAGADLAQAELSDADLRGTNLAGANLDSANLSGVDLRNANLVGANLHFASAVGTVLRRAHLMQADLRRILLDLPDVREADLRQADLRGAEIVGADLRTTDLRGARLEGATYDDLTRWPKGFVPQQHGAVRKLTAEIGAEGAVEEHISPDGRLTFRVVREADGDILLGFAGFPWHTHGDILAALTGLAEMAAIRRYVDDLIGGRSVVALWSVAGELRDIWVSDNPERDANYPQAGESIELRFWDGSPWPRLTSTT